MYFKEKWILGLAISIIVTQKFVKQKNVLKRGKLMSSKIISLKRGISKRG
jgi:hypothetical protein